MSPKTRQKEFVCSRCGKKFSTQSGRSKHYKKCDKQIVAKEKLYETENGKIKCKLCSKPFTSLTNVYKHVKKVHSILKLRKSEVSKVQNVTKCLLANGKLIDII